MHLARRLHRLRLEQSKEDGEKERLSTGSDTPAGDEEDELPLDNREDDHESPQDFTTCRHQICEDLRVPLSKITGRSTGLSLIISNFYLVV